MKKILIFIVISLLAFGCTTVDMDQQRTFVWWGTYEGVTAQWYVRCWDSYNGSSCYACQFSKNRFPDGYVDKDGSDNNNVSKKDNTEINKLQSGSKYYDVYLTCIGIPLDNFNTTPSPTPPDPVKPGNVGTVMYMANKQTQYGYDDYPDEKFEENYRKYVNGSYSPKWLFNNPWDYFYDNEYIDFISLESGEQTSFTVYITDEYFKLYKEIDAAMLNPNDPIVFINESNQEVQKLSLKSGYNNIKIKSTNNMRGVYQIVKEGYYDPKNRAALVDNKLNIIVYDKKQIANDKIAVILLNNPIFPDSMKTQQGWKDYLWKYLKQAVVYPPEIIEISTANVNIDKNKIVNSEVMADIILELNKDSRFKGILELLSPAAKKCYIIIGSWDMPDNILGSNFGGISYIKDINCNKSTAVHELLHSPLFGSMQHIDDPINLMYKYENGVDILRNRETKSIEPEIKYYYSQWEIIRNLEIME
jgi:hypothetical protein